MKHFDNIARDTTIASVFSIITLSLAVCFLPSVPIYDEDYYLVNTINLAKETLGWFDFAAHRGPTGPGYAWFHSIIWKFLPDIVALRIANTLLLLGTFILSLTATRDRESLFHSIAIFAFPGIYVAAGMALTEMFSVFFIALGLWVWSRNLKSLLGLIAGAAILAVAAFSRQTLLVLAAPFFLMPWVERVQSGRLRWEWLLGLIVFLLLLLPMFSSWNGLLPADNERRMIAGESGFRLRPSNLFLGLAYLSAFILPCTLQWEIIKQLFLPKALIPGILAGLLVWLLGFGYLPMRTTVESVVGLKGAAIAELVFPIAAGVSGTILVIIAWANRKSLRNLSGSFTAVDWFALLSIGAIWASNGAIGHQFSSRYLIVAAPLVAHLLRHFYMRKWVLFMLIGLNAVSLLSYSFT